MSPRRIFLILTILGAVAFGLGELQFHPLLSQGDLGRDLYSAQEALRGKLPYKDYWWVYGPLMPYYFAFFYKLFGSTVGSFLLGKVVLKVACAVLFYLGARTLIAPSVAFLAAMWFTQSQQDFFFTFNHIGGIAAQMAIVFLLFSYIQEQRMRLLWWTIPTIFLYCLIKINFGLAALAITFISTAGIDCVNKNPLTAEKKKFYAILLGGIPLVVGLIYWLLLKDIPFYAVRQCLPYFGDDQPYHYSPSVTIPYFFTQHWLTFVHSSINMAVGIVLHSATLISAFLLATGRIAGQQRKKILLALGVLGIYFVLNFHEFVVSGVWYRTFWSLPFLFMFHFLMMATAFSVFPALLRRAVWSGFGALLTIGLLASFFSPQQQHISPRFLNSPKGQVWVGNEFEWTYTVNTVTKFLDQNLKEDETFFALPYDCIYYFLTGKESPTRQTIFFDHIKISREQEIGIIKELVAKKVPYVILSNRMNSTETGLGTFGKTYCPLISAYIADNYVPVTRIGGNWEQEPGWGNNHGVLILKKK